MKSPNTAATTTRNRKRARSLKPKRAAAGWMFIKIPDEWRRKQEEQTLFRTIYGFAVPILLFGGIGMTALVLFFKNLSSDAMRAIPWRRLLLWSSAGLVAYILIVGFGNRIQSFLNAYDTAIPFKAMLGGIAIAILVGAFFYLGGLAALFGFASYFSNRAFGSERLPVGSRMPGVYYRDALWIGVCGTAGFLGLRRLMEFITFHWQTVHRSLPFSFGQNFDAGLPVGRHFRRRSDQQLVRDWFHRVHRCVCGGRSQGSLVAVRCLPAGRDVSRRKRLGHRVDFAKQFLADAHSAGSDRLRR